MKRWLEGWKYVAFLTILVVSALMIMDFNSRLAEYKRLSTQRDAVSVQVTNLAETESSLQTQIAYATSESGVMEWAYEDGHWVRQGDMLVVPISPKQSTPVPKPTVVITPTPMSNWQLWMTLFVDPQ